MEKFSLVTLSEKEKNIAVQRLTALWAFVECGIGGLMHSFKFPFTGLVVGGFAILIISLIAKICYNHLSEIFKSLVIVLIIKLSLSPLTPFTAYIAVVFQATIGYWVFLLLGNNSISIILLSVICMLQSALQKLIVLTIFFGQDLWSAFDKLMSAITPSLSFLNSNASFYLLSVYLLIYTVGGFLIGMFISKIIALDNIEYNSNIRYITSVNTKENSTKKKQTKIYLAILLIALVCTHIYFINTQNTFTAIVKYIVITSGLIWIWYYFLSPFFIKIINKLLQSKKQKYQEELNNIFEILPHIKLLFISIYKESKTLKGRSRLAFIIQNIIIHAIIFNKEK